MQKKYLHFFAPESREMDYFNSNKKAREMA